MDGAEYFDKVTLQWREYFPKTKMAHFGKNCAGAKKNLEKAQTKISCKNCQFTIQLMLKTYHE